MTTNTAGGQHLNELPTAFVATVHPACTLRENAQIDFANILVLVPDDLLAAFFHEGKLEWTADPDAIFAVVTADAGRTLLTSATDCDVSNHAEVRIQPVKSGGNRMRERPNSSSLCGHNRDKGNFYPVKLFQPPVYISTILSVCNRCNPKTNNRYS